MDFISQVKRILPRKAIKINEPMRLHTTFRIGGPADYFLEPSADELKPLLEACSEYRVPSLVIGNGSNLLVGDLGVRGAVICLGRRMSEITTEDTGSRGVIRAQAGALFSTVSYKALELGLEGMEFASGIPGSVGGALVMNAGAYGSEMKDIIRSLTVMDRRGNVFIWDLDDYDGGYRDSAIFRKQVIALEAEIVLPKGDILAIKAKMDDLKQKRADKQPLDKPSAGSTFKRPPNNFAGKLIMDAGLSGFAVGGAAVSEKHCGFVVNNGGATAGDVVKLIEEVRRRVKIKSGIVLEPEIKMVGEFN